jgi:hypothetical protein
MPKPFSRDAVAQIPAVAPADAAPEPVGSTATGDFLEAVPTDSPAWHQRYQSTSRIPHIPPMAGLVGFVALGLIVVLVARFVFMARL